jgi:hypothetical protein
MTTNTCGLLFGVIKVQELALIVVQDVQYTKNYLTVHFKRMNLQYINYISTFLSVSDLCE